MKETDKAWIAGFIDGEGSLTIAKQIRKDRPSPAYRAQVSASNTDTSPLEFIHSLYGGSLYKGKPYQVGVNGKPWRPSWQWYCKVSRQKEFLLDILPYLQSKRGQAEVLLEFIENKNAFARGKRLEGKHGGSAPLTQEEIDYREELRHRVRMLNTKSVYSRANE